MSSETRAVERHGHGEAEHAGPKTYVLIALILGVLTAAEVAVYEIDAFDSVRIPVLMVLTASKFALVVMYFMHLKFDSRIFSGVFVAPLFLGIAMIAALIVLIKVLPHVTL